MISDLTCKGRPNGKKKGVLMPLFSLPSRYGIGCISKEAYEFVDWLAKTGHEYWQVLPLNPTGVADSPYQPLSSFAGNAYFIDPAAMIEHGLLTHKEVAAADPGAGCGSDAGCDAGCSVDPDADFDASSDAGCDAGSNAGCDAGCSVDPDADFDASLDAGCDAGTDAGCDAAVGADGDAGCGYVDYEGLYDVRMRLLLTAYRRFDANECAGGGSGPSSSGQVGSDPDGSNADAGRTDGNGPAGSDTDGSNADAGRTDGSGQVGSNPDGSNADAGRTDGSGQVEFQGFGSREFRQFCDENEDWLDDYGMFMALRERFGKELSWDEWPEPLRKREAWALDEARSECAEWIGFYKWTQFEFYREWSTLKKYANAAGVKIIGDMPIYVSYDSADCWANPGQFQLDKDLRPLLVAGVPPDAFAAEGQLWGNPLYDWERMRSEKYSWWTARIRQCFKMYDVLRLDHFRGFESYYAVPASAENAMCGEWKKGPGMSLFERLDAEIASVRCEAKAGAECESGAGGSAAGESGAGESAAGESGAGESGAGESAAGESGAGELPHRFIAEDLGFLTEDVHQLLWESGFPGTKVLQFGFDGDPGNIYLPENYPENCVVYTGTHDNDTTVGWFESLEDWEREPILRYLGIDPAAHPRTAEQPSLDDAGQQSPADADQRSLAEAVCDALIEKALTSRADLCIIPLQDYLHLGSEARTNIPGTVGCNWRWRQNQSLQP